MNQDTVTGYSTEMASTMHEIETQDQPPNRRNGLIKDMSELEQEIKTAEQDVNKPNGEAYISVSPEQASARQKAIIFLKRNLAKKKLEYEEMNK